MALSPTEDALFKCMVVLARLEWSGRDKQGKKCCPICKQPTLKQLSHQHGLHKKTCKLYQPDRAGAAVIGDLVKAVKG